MVHREATRPIRKPTASVQINGTLAGPVPIQIVVRQGCPLSMIL